MNKCSNEQIKNYMSIMNMNIIITTMATVAADMTTSMTITSMTTMSITTLQRIFRQTTRQRFIPLKIWVVPTVPQRWRAGLTS